MIDCAPRGSQIAPRMNNIRTGSGNTYIPYLQIHAARYRFQIDRTRFSHLMNKYCHTVRQFNASGIGNI